MWILHAGKGGNTGMRENLEHPREPVAAALWPRGGRTRRQAPGSLARRPRDNMDPRAAEARLGLAGRKRREPRGSRLGQPSAPRANHAAELELVRLWGCTLLTLDADARDKAQNKKKGPASPETAGQGILARPLIAGPGGRAPGLGERAEGPGRPRADRCRKVRGQPREQPAKAGALAQAAARVRGPTRGLRARGTGLGPGPGQSREEARDPGSGGLGRRAAHSPLPRLRPPLGDAGLRYEATRAALPPLPASRSGRLRSVRPAPQRPAPPRPRPPQLRGPAPGQRRRLEGRRRRRERGEARPGPPGPRGLPPPRCARPGQRPPLGRSRNASLRPSPGPPQRPFRRGRLLLSSGAERGSDGGGKGTWGKPHPTFHPKGMFPNSQPHPAPHSRYLLYKVVWVKTAQRRKRMKNRFLGGLYSQNCLFSPTRYPC